MTAEAVATFTTLLPGTGGTGTLLGETAGLDPALLSNPTVLWTGTFDSGNWQAAWGNPSVYKPGNIAVVTPTLARSRYGKALRITFREPGHPDNTGGTGYGAELRCNFGRMGIATNLDNLWLHYEVYYPTDFTKYAGGKHPGLAANNNPSLTTLNGGGTYAEDSWSGRLMFRGSDIVSYLYVFYAGGQLISQNINKDNGRLYGIERALLNPTTGAKMVPTLGAWNKYDLHYGLNTPGVNNGVFEAYKDGVRGLNLTDVRYRMSNYPNMHTTHMMTDFFFGGPTANTAEEDLETDNFVISTARVTLAP